MATVLLCVLSSPTGVQGQTLRLNLQQLEDASDAVVLGRMVSSESAWTADRSAILTRVDIEVHDPETGAVIGMQTVTVPGGQVGEYVHEVSDMPYFREGEEVAVFLTQHPTGAMIVTGGWQGKLEIVSNPSGGEKRILGAEHLMEEEVTGFLATGNGSEVERQRKTFPLSEFVKRVKKLDREQ
ncbi:MAG: hypothetical protein ACI84D_002280 [Thalassolituus oleivorans]